MPYANAGVIQLVRKSGELLEEEYREDGIYIRAYERCQQSETQHYPTPAWSWPY